MPVVACALLQRLECSSPSARDGRVYLGIVPNSRNLFLLQLLRVHGRRGQYEECRDQQRCDVF